MYVLTVRNCSHFCWMNVMNVTVFYLLPLAKYFLAGKDRGWQRRRWLDHITDSDGHEFDSRVKFRELVKDREA